MILSNPSTICKVAWFASGLIGLVLIAKYKGNKNVLLGLLIATIIYGFIVSTPSKALDGAPFHQYPQRDIAYLACSQIAVRFKVCGEMALSTDQVNSFRKCICTGENALPVMANCLNVGFPSQINLFIQTCNKQPDVELSHQNFSLALDKYSHLATNTTSFSFDDIHIPLVPDLVVYTYRDSYDQFLGNYNRSVEYAIPIILFWGAVFVISAIGNWSKVLCPGLVKYFTGPISNKVRTKVTLPALWGKKRTQEVRFAGILDYLQPTRSESLILLAFSLSILYLCLTNIHSVKNDIIFPSKVLALTRYYSVRTGILATHILPLSILFAGRNNFLQTFTRWEYSTFLTFHRWISRIIVILVVIHSVGYGYILHEHRSAIKSYVYFGAIGTYTGIALLIHALLILRRNFYEIFLVLHIFFAAVFIVAAWLHVKDLRFLWFYHFALWVWLLDRILRLHRIFSFGFPTAEIKLYSDSTLKVIVPMPTGFKTIPGGHCFVHFLLPCSFWQSHPFTYTVKEDEIIFYVKTKQGITSKLMKTIEQSGSQSIFVRVAVEGSYGEPTPAMRYQSKIFVAGGNGIPGIYAEALNACKNSPSHSKTQLIWVVRDNTSIEWFHEELASLKGLSIEVKIFRTSPGESTPLLLFPGLLLKTYEKELCHVKFLEGRPDISKLVSVAVSESTGSTCFVTCGHPAMVDSVRHEVIRSIEHSSSRLDYFEQLQVWA